MGSVVCCLVRHNVSRSIHCLRYAGQCLLALEHGYLHFYVLAFGSGGCGMWSKREELDNSKVGEIMIHLYMRVQLELFGFCTNYGNCGRRITRHLVLAVLAAVALAFQ